MSAIREMVYVVDDDASVRVGLDRLLRSAGFRVVTYADPGQFLEDEREEDTACVILDMMMPGIFGLEVQKRLRVESPELPVIFISGHLLPPMQEQAMEQGAVEVFEKPFEGEAILEAVRRAIG
ncbi:MAG: response regulator [Deltaproteobacteria bacterium]|nr:response regulator [Deltaproteobacteria bacterium]